MATNVRRKLAAALQHGEMMVWRMMACGLLIVAATGKLALWKAAWH